MTTSPASETPRPVTVPTLQDRARVLAPLGWSGREAEWIALVALHTGVFTRSQWCHFFGGANREAARVFVRALIDKQLAIEDERAIFPGGARAVLLTGKALYRALGIPRQVGFPTGTSDGPSARRAGGVGRRIRRGDVGPHRERGCAARRPVASAD